MQQLGSQHVSWTAGSFARLAQDKSSMRRFICTTPTSALWSLLRELRREDLVRMLFVPPAEADVMAPGLFTISSRLRLLCSY